MSRNRSIRWTETIGFCMVSQSDSGLDRDAGISDMSIAGHVAADTGSFSATDADLSTDRPSPRVEAEFQNTIDTLHGRGSGERLPLTRLGGLFVVWSANVSRSALREVLAQLGDLFLAELRRLVNRQLRDEL